jgi:myo-inositol 2-dehydrogenase/D-chiro-inositol 1-dehydrogenase
MRFGLIGVGRMGAHHAGILAGLEGVTELLIADAVPGRAEQVAASFAKARASEIGEVLRRSEALVIASSTDTHAELLAAAAEARLPTFCEKPIALDLESTKAGLAAIKKAGITVQMGLQRRYDPGIRAIWERISTGELGTPYMVRSQTHDPAPPPLDYIPTSGGIFKDCLVHDIDVVRFVTGQEITSVSAAATNVGHPDIAALGDYATATMIGSMSGGTLAQLSGMRRDPNGYDVRLEVFGPNGALAAGWSERTPITSTEPGVGPTRDPIITFWDRFDAAYRLQLEAFVRVAAGAEAPASTPDDAYQALRVAEACGRSVAEGRTVLLEEIE